MNISDKEREVLKHLCEGLPYKQIAQKTGTTKGTIKNILADLRVKFSCSNSVTLALYAKENILSDKSHPVKANKGR